MSSGIIELKNVGKYYGDREVLRGINLEVYRGESLALLGPKGSGKTSILKMLYGFSYPSSGEIYVLGMNVRANIREIKTRIGVIPQDDSLEEDFTVIENLKIYSQYHEVPKNEVTERCLSLLRTMNLENYSERPVTGLPLLARRKLLIARAIIHKPETIIIDEPTRDLDLEDRLSLLQLIKKIKSSNISVLLATQDGVAAQLLCDRVAFIDGGRILGVDKPDKLIESLIGKYVVEIGCNDHEINYYTNKLQTERMDYLVVRNTILVMLKDGQDPRRILDQAVGFKATIRRPCLDDVFLKLSGHQMR
ncbi:MAG: ABC transporter ATP-binding protein [Bdellovibrionaceae bacterium]|nr:ABC transporter ATP-binding protein [Pseudobdellovibrionaceae bacterium]